MKAYREKTRIHYQANVTSLPSIAKNGKLVNPNKKYDQDNTTPPPEKHPEIEDIIYNRLPLSQQIHSGLRQDSPQNSIIHR